MDWWKEFPGWLVTTALAFLAFAVVAWQEIRRRLLLPRAAWEGAMVHSPIANGSDDSYFSLKNTGDIDARRVMVLAYNCTIPGNNPGALFDVAKSMSSNRVELESVDEDSYVVVIWRSPHHRSRSLSTWLPVQQGTALASHHWEQKTWPWYKVFWAGMRHKHRAAPGAAHKAWLSDSPRRLVKTAKKLKVKVPPHS